MPLFGLSASIIPYFMAMIFTMLVLNGNNPKVTAGSSSVLSKTVSVHSIKMSVGGENIFSGQNIKQNTTETAALTNFYLKHVSRQTLFRNGCFKKLILQPLPSGTVSHRGPPALIS